MIEFKAPQLKDKPWVDELLAFGDDRGCEYNFTTLFIWQGTYHQEIARVGDFLVIRLQTPMGYSYAYPAGQGDVFPVIAALGEEAHAQGTALRLVGVTPEHVRLLEESFPEVFTFTEHRDSFDYLYEINRMADLKGKRLHAKRNHINRFMEQNPTWVFEPITPASLPECAAMDREWLRRRLARMDVTGEQSPEMENAALEAALEHFEALGLEGGLLRVEGEVVAFTIGDRICSDTYDVHFEKAFHEMQGAYAMINREFARWVREAYPEIRYVNREEDLGIEGLRRAKQSYDPDLMQEKYGAISKEGWKVQYAYPSAKHA